MSILKYLKTIINPSGGLFYHYSAFKYKKQLWRPFVEDLNIWLEDWSPESHQLLLIGPSGGYSLSKEFLQKFERVDVFDPDPLAEFIFKKKFRLSNINWHKKDRFGLLNSEFKPFGVIDLLTEFPQHSILFCNFLGQVPILLKSNPQKAPFEELYKNWKKSLNIGLKGRNWASYHDLYSMRENEPHIKTDHLTEGLLNSNNMAKHIKWQRLPNEVHIIEAIYDS